MLGAKSQAGGHKPPPAPVPMLKRRLQPQRLQQSCVTVPNGDSHAPLLYLVIAAGHVCMTAHLTVEHASFASAGCKQTTLVLVMGPCIGSLFCPAYLSLS